MSFTLPQIDKLNGAKAKVAFFATFAELNTRMILERDNIYCGDSRQLSKLIEDESVDLVFTDPVYQNIEDYMWTANESYRILKPGKACLMWQGQQWLDKTIVALSVSSLTYRWVLGWYASNNMQMVGKVGRNLAPLLWYEKGKSNPIKGVREVVEVPIPIGKSPYKWAKRPEAVAYYLNKFTNEGDLIVDFFCGSGTLPEVCKKYNRHFIAFELQEELVRQGNERLRNIHPNFLIENKVEQIDLAI